MTTLLDDKNPLFTGILAYAVAAFRKTLSSPRLNVPTDQPSPLTPFGI
jgi:hypothetical protein